MNFMHLRLTILQFLVVIAINVDMLIEFTYAYLFCLADERPKGPDICITIVSCLYFFRID
jgi:hypothetical protein